MKSIIFLLILLTALVISDPIPADFPFSVSSSFSLNPLSTKAVLTPNTLLRLAGVKSIEVGVKFPPCGNSAQFYMDLTAWPSPINRVFTQNVSIVFPRICAADFGVNIPFTQACFRIDDVSIYKQVVMGKINADVSVGITALQYTVANVTLYDFLVGNTSSSPCFKKSSSEACLAQPECGWCTTSKACLEKRTDGLSDVCRWCPRCSFITTSDLKAECLKKDSCGWCGAMKMCLAGDRIGPLDPSLMCGAVDSVISDVSQSATDDEWSYGQKDTNLVEPGLVAGLSFIFIGFGLVVGTIFGAMVVLLGVHLTKRR